MPTYNTYQCASCGASYEARPCDYKKSRTKTCSISCAYKVREHPSTKDLVGQTFDQLTVISRAENSLGRRGCRWNVACSCGSTLVVRNEAPIGRTKNKKVSCGCHTGGIKNRSSTNSPFWQSPNEIALRYLTHAKSGADKRSIEFLINLPYLKEVLLDQNYQCALTGLPLIIDHKDPNHNASIDRIDSERGYVEGNIQWVDKRFNRLKWDLSEDTLAEMCRVYLAHYDSKHQQDSSV